MMGAKERFIADTLSSQGQKTYDLQTKAIQSGYRQRTGKLLSGRTVYTNDDSITLVHPIYERFLDIKNRRRKSKRIHNRFVYGLVYSILGSLSAGYREEVTDIVNELRDNISNN